MNTSKPDPYTEFSAIYDDWQALHPQPFSLAMTVRMHQALDEWGVPDPSLLDVACGSGTLAHWWAQRHPDWRIVGVDPSAAMIAKARAGSSGAIATSPSLARRRAAGGRGRKSTPGTSAEALRFDHTSPAHLALDEAFGMATCFFDSLNHVLTQHELLATLRRVRRHLLPGGLFLFDLIDEDSFEETFSSPWIVQSDSLFVGTESEYLVRRNAEYGRVVFTCFEKRASAKNARSTARSRKGTDPRPTWYKRQFAILERCWRREQFDPMLAEAGLENIHVQLIDPEEQPDVFVPRRLYVCRPMK